MVDFSELSKETQLRTRGGLDVIEWWKQEDVPDTFFPVRAKVMFANGEIKVLPYTRGGRRYINIASRYDLMIREHKKQKKQKKHKKCQRQEPGKHDVMPDVMRAIACARKKDFTGVKSANKSSKCTTDKEVLRYNYIIGSSDEGLG